MHGNGLVLKYEKPIDEKFYEKYAWIIYQITGVMVLVGVIHHTFSINMEPALFTLLAPIQLTKLKSRIQLHTRVRF
jgi:hypothetical protein